MTSPCSERSDTATALRIILGIFPENFQGRRRIRYFHIFHIARMDDLDFSLLLMSLTLPSHNFAPCMRETRRGRSRSLSMDFDCLRRRTTGRSNLTSSRSVSGGFYSPRRRPARMSLRRAPLQELEPQEV